MELNPKIKVTLFSSSSEVCAVAIALFVPPHPRFSKFKSFAPPGEKASPVQQVYCNIIYYVYLCVTSA